MWLMRMLSPTLSCVTLYFVRLTALMLNGMRLSFKHLIQFILPKINCILLKINLHTWYTFGRYRHFTADFLQYGTTDSLAFYKSSSKTQSSAIHSCGAPADSMTFILGYVYITELL